MGVFIHRSIETVIKRREETFSSDLLLGEDIELPWKNCYQTHIDVVLKQTTDLTADGMVVEGEMIDT